MIFFETMDWAFSGLKKLDRAIGDLMSYISPVEKEVEIIHALRGFEI